MRIHVSHPFTSSPVAPFAFAVALCFTPAFASDGLPDPEITIKRHGPQSQRLGDDGKTIFFRYTERTTTRRLGELEAAIAALPKHPDLLRFCDFLRGSVKAMLLQQQGASDLDIAVVNYGYVGATVSCVLKYMSAGQVGTQVTFAKKAPSGMYMLFVTN